MIIPDTWQGGDVNFAHSGATVIIKWSKTIKDRRHTSTINIPYLGHSDICTIVALKTMLSRIAGLDNDPLFMIIKKGSLVVLTNSVARKHLKKVFGLLDIQPPRHFMHSAEPPPYGLFSTGFHWNTSRLTAHGNLMWSGHTSGRFPLPTPLLLEPLGYISTFNFGPWESQIIYCTAFHYYLLNSCSLDIYTISRSGELVQVLALFSFKTGGRVQGLPLSFRSSLTLHLYFSSEGLACYLRLFLFLVRAPLAQRSKVDKVLN